MSGFRCYDLVGAAIGRPQNHAYGGRITMEKKAMGLIIAMMSIFIVFLILAAGVVENISAQITIVVSVIVAASMITIALIFSRKKDQK